MVGTVWWGSILLQGPNLGSTSALQSFVQSWSTLREEGHPQMFWLLEGSELDTFQICKWPNPKFHSKGCVGIWTLSKWPNHLPLITIPGTFFALLESESDYWGLKGNHKFVSVWSNQLGKAQQTMDQTLESFGSGLTNANMNILGRKTDKCNQCDFASSQAGHLRTHLKTHSGEGLNKCNQCGFDSFYSSS